MVRWTLSARAKSSGAPVSVTNLASRLAVYWSILGADLFVEDPATLTLPADALLLGRITRQYPPSIPLPESLPAGQGRLILYSLAHGEILGWADLEIP